MEFQNIFLTYYNDLSWESFFSLARQLQSNISYNFKQEELFLKALAVRGSKLPTDEFERLEFLGDSILQSIIGLTLFNTFQTHPPGKLTRLRSLISENEHLALLSLKFHLDEVGRILNIGRLNESQRADLFEAVIGAIFLDTILDFNKSMDLILPLLDIDSVIQRVEDSPWGDKDPKSFLHETIQKKYGNNVKITYTSKNLGEANNPEFIVTITLSNVSNGSIIDQATSSGSNKEKKSEKQAAEVLLLKWQKNKEL